MVTLESRKQDRCLDCLG